MVGILPDSTIAYQLTTSRRGRQIRLSTLWATEIFQLTTSRRGRRPYKLFGLSFSHFNSLPHAEVDSSTTTTIILSDDFNSLPHAEVDRSLSDAVRYTTYFNSLPHAEVDGQPRLFKQKNNISTHYLTQR